jgi:hypothetical protein
MKIILVILICFQGECKYIVSREPQFTLKAECEQFSRQVLRTVDQKISNSHNQVMCLNELQLAQQQLLWYYEGIPQAEQ